MRKPINREQTLAFLRSLESPAPQAAPRSVRKGLPDFARVAVAQQGNVNNVAAWTEDRNELVKHIKQTAAVAINARGVKLSQSRPVARRHTVNGHTDLSPNHPLSRLLARVNPIWPMSELVRYASMWKDATGDAYILIDRDSSLRPRYLWPVPSQWVRVIPSRDAFIEAYEIRGIYSTPREFPRTDVLRWSNPNPDWSGNGRYYGASLLGQAAASVDCEESIYRRVLADFRNFAPPGLHYTTEEVLTEEQILDIYSQVLAQHAAAETTGRPVVTHSGFSVTEFESTQREHHKPLDAMRDQILSVFGVSKVVAGLTTDVNRASAFAAQLAFVEQTINPLLASLSEVFTMQLAAEFGDDLVIEFPALVVDDADSTRRDVEVLLKHGAMTKNEAREKLLGLPPMPGGDAPPAPQPQAAQLQTNPAYRLNGHATNGHAKAN